MGLIDIVFPKKCVGCGSLGDYVCLGCRGSVERSQNSLRYQGVIRKIIKEIKYRGTHDLVKTLVEVWDQEVGKLLNKIPCETIVTAVPMYDRKRRIRGFNQAELIAREIARKKGFEYRELLVRKRETKPMYKLTEVERAQNVKGAFDLSKGVNSICQNVILVDDVYTSGATTRECTRILKQVCSKEVIVVVVAR